MVTLSVGRAIQIRHAISGGSTGYSPDKPYQFLDFSGLKVTPEEFAFVKSNWSKQGTLAVYLFLYQTERILYPWRESIRSALALVEGRGTVFVTVAQPVDGTPDDGTVDLCLREFADEHADHRIRIGGGQWGNSHEVQTRLANDLLSWIGTDYEWALKLDADEVLHEASFENFWNDLAIMRSTYKILGRPHYTHFCPDDTTTWPFIYDSKAVLTATRSGLRFHDPDACALGGDGIPEFQTRLEIFHYGKMQMGREREALDKEHRFQQLYTDLGFPDPKVEALIPQGYMDYMKVFDLSAGRGEFKPFTGQHPSFMDAYLASARFRALKFRRDVLHG